MDSLLTSYYYISNIDIYILLPAHSTICGICSARGSSGSPPEPRGRSGPGRAAGLKGKGPSPASPRPGAPAAAAQRRGRRRAAQALREPRQNMAGEGPAVESPPPAPVSCA